MTFRKIDYLHWARSFMGRSRYDLACSNVKPLTREEMKELTTGVDLSVPYEETRDALRSFLAGRYGVAPERVLITSGATMGIFLACAAALDGGDEAILEAPNYEPLYRVPVHLGVGVRMVDRRFENGWQIDVEQLERRVSRATRAVILTNLHNPSGTATNAEKMTTIGQIARSCGARVIVSEVYLDSAFAPGLRPAAACGDNLVSLGSMSKVYGLGTLRIGWMVASEDAIERATAVADYIGGSIPGPTQAIALAALRRSDALVARCRDLVQRNAKTLADWLRRRDNLRWVEPDGGTVCMLKLPPRVDAVELSTLLRDKYATLVAPGDFFWIKGFLRVSLGVDEETLRVGLKHLGTALDQILSPRRR